MLREEGIKRSGEVQVVWRRPDGTSLWTVSTSGQV